MKLETLQKQVQKITDAHRAEYAKRLRNEKRRKEPNEYSVTRLERQAVKGSPLSLSFRKRSGVFTNSKGTCTLDLVSESGFSYKWWQMFGRINGRLVLNVYSYSHATAGHIGSARAVLNKLRIKYIEIEAPNGLQNLEIAKVRELELYAKSVVENKYARLKVAETKLTKATQQRFSRLAAVGIDFDLADLSKALNSAEADRRRRLDHSKRRRALRAELHDSMSETMRNAVISIAA